MKLAKDKTSAYVHPEPIDKLGLFYIALVSVRGVVAGAGDKTIDEGDDTVEQRVAVKGGYVPFWENDRPFCFIVLKDGGTATDIYKKALYAKDVYTNEVKVAFFESAEEAEDFWVKLKAQVQKTQNNSKHCKLSEEDRIAFGFIPPDKDSPFDGLNFESDKTLECESWPIEVFRKKETSEKLENPPKEVKFPDDLKDKIRYDSSTRLLIFKGAMSEGEKNKLLGLSEDGQYKEAIKALFQKSYLPY